MEGTIGEILNNGLSYAENRDGYRLVFDKESLRVINHVSI